MENVSPMCCFITMATTANDFVFLEASLQLMAGSTAHYSSWKNSCLVVSIIDIIYFVCLPTLSISSTTFTPFSKFVSIGLGDFVLNPLLNVLD